MEFRVWVVAAMQEFEEKPAKTIALDAGVCCQCRYWEQGQAKSEMGLCHRRAPLPSGWPATGGQEWCGDFKASGATAAKRIFALSNLTLAVLFLLFLISTSVSQLVG
ncbi:hypothetical protein [Novosphingobium sp.]|uniref:hypothetical protein n=1 Tax=Novosphingobium sp. TaxID=1874826 RepID=UPI001EB0FAD4|nr:hypothetical protein [Novosphingobium sp.]MBK9010200.1 hypothetical protein [Novosphingobium sp.]